jgi:hypothetical protein
MGKLGRLFVYFLFFFLILGSTVKPTSGEPGDPPEQLPQGTVYSKPVPGIDPEPPPFLETKPVNSVMPLESDGVEPNADYWTFIDWSLIVYQSYNDGNWELYVTENRNPRRLTNSSASDTNPDLNDTAHRIAWNSNMRGSHDIYVMNFDGTGVSRLTSIAGSDEYDPSWSPDGARIAYVSKQNGNPDIYVMNSNGTGSTRLTASSDPEFNPNWSPDGTKITYVQSAGNMGKVMVMNSDGSTKQALTDPYPYLSHPAWSPDGTKIAFDADSDGDIFNEIMLLDLSSGFSQTFVDAGYSAMDYYAGNWSHDGNFLTLTRMEYYLSGQTYEYSGSWIYVYNMEYLGVTSVSTAYDSAYPDVESLDTQLPVSQMNPLPQYSRSSPYEISSQGQDYGVSGILGYEYQYRLGETGVWTPIYQFGGTSGTFYDPSCAQVYFRTRAIDNAGNVEAWPANPDYDATTRQFDSILSGQVVDNRAVPLPGATMEIPSAILPAATDNSGNYSTLVCNQSTGLVNAAKPGYGSFPPVIQAWNADTRASLYLPPVDNAIVNGGFEGALGLNGWTAEGVLPAKITGGHSGIQAARLGKVCSGLCLTDPLTLFEADTYTTLALKEDSLGNLHVITSKLKYVRRNPQGVWGIPTDMPHPAGMTGGTNMEVELDGQNALHMIIKGSDNNHYYYYRPAGGNWTYSTFSGFWSAQIAVNPAGDVYMPFFIHSPNQGFYIMRKPAGGSWSQPILLVPNISLDGRADVAFDENGLPNIFVGYRLSATTIQRFIWRADGQFDSDVLYTDLPGLGPRRLLAYSSMDHTIILWVDSYYLFHPVGGEWSSPIYLPQGAEYISPTIDASNQMRVLTIPNDNFKMNYYAGPLGQPLTLITIWPMQNFYPQGAAMNYRTNGKIQITYIDASHAYYRETPETTQLEEGSLVQSVTLPDVHSPTLAFDYRSENLSGSFRVNVTGPGGTSDFSQLMETDWSQGWIDLEPWENQTITVRFTLSQEAGSLYNSLSLDDISLGAWLTPVVNAATPGSLEQYSGDLITVTGENFMEGATVLLDELSVSPVTVLDDHTLTFNLPVGITIGIYDLWVINPGGQSGYKPGGLRLGWSTHVPLLRR